MIKRPNFEQAPIFYVCANILGKRQYFDNFCLIILLDFVAANICVYFQYLFMHFLCANIFGAIVLKPRFKIDVVVVVVILSIVIIINSVLTLQVSTASLPHCAANFSFAQLAKRKSLGRSKPTTYSQSQALQHTVWNVSTISKPY